MSDLSDSAKKADTSLTLTRKSAEILLAAVLLSRSASFLFSKVLLETMSPFMVMGLRFLLAGTVLIAVLNGKFRGLSPAVLKKGAILGAGYFAMMSFEMFGLRTVSSSSAALLEGTAIIFVPIFEGIINRKMPSARVFLSVLVTFLGVALLTGLGSGLSLGSGELLCMGASVTYAVCIILTNRLAQDDDPVVLGGLQVTFMGILGLVAAFLFEVPSLPGSLEGWGSILFLAILCGSFGFAMQPVAQKFTTSERAAVMNSVNPLGAMVLGMIFLHENPGVYGLIGAILILGGILLQSMSPAQPAAIKQS